MIANKQFQLERWNIEIRLPFLQLICHRLEYTGLKHSFTLDNHTTLIATLNRCVDQPRLSPQGREIALNGHELFFPGAMQVSRINNKATLLEFRAVMAQLPNPSNDPSKGGRWPDRDAVRFHFASSSQSWPVNSYMPHLAQTQEAILSSEDAGLLARTLR